jgi:hypothetical protein
MGFRPAVYEDQVWLPPPIWRQNNGAIAETLAGLDPFDEVYFLTACWTPVTPPIQRGISIGITSLQVPDNKSNGGEGGIRTPDTLSGMPVFKTGAINHSATSPALIVLL